MHYKTAKGIFQSKRDCVNFRKDSSEALICLERLRETDSFGAGLTMLANSNDTSKRRIRLATDEKVWITFISPLLCHFLIPLQQKKKSLQIKSLFRKGLRLRCGKKPKLTLKCSEDDKLNDGRPSWSHAKTVSILFIQLNEAPACLSGRSSVAVDDRCKWRQLLFHVNFFISDSIGQWPLATSQLSK